MRKALFLVPVLAAGLIAGGLAVPGTARDRKSADPARIPEVRPLGKPVDCIPLGYVKDTLVQSDQVIDFVMVTQRYYRVELPQACVGLAAAGRFGYAKGATQLCATDAITIAAKEGDATGATCSLAKFHPVEPVQRRF